MYKCVIVVLFSIFYLSCQKAKPNIDGSGKNILEVNTVFEEKVDHQYSDTVYVPIYSSIYSESKYNSTLLTATLSIRSTSLTDTTFVNSIEYFGTNGDKVKDFIDQPILLKPMQSIDYVIDRDDDTGGTGANFLVTWSAKQNTNPIFQAVMIGTNGQHGLSFIVDGVSLKKVK
jgi:hypothetical protein